MGQIEDMLTLLGPIRTPQMWVESESEAKFVVRAIRGRRSSCLCLTRDLEPNSIVGLMVGW